MARERRGGRVDHRAMTARKQSRALHVIGVRVRDENRPNRGGLDAQAPQPTHHLGVRQTRVDEHSLAAVCDERRVPAAATAEDRQLNADS